jgi:hypothetical protein
MAGMGLGFYLIQNFCRGTGSNAGHQLEHPEPCNPVTRVLAPPEDAEHIFDVGRLQEFQAAILHEWDVAPGQFNLELGTMVRGSEQDSLGFQRHAGFPRF